MMKRMIVVAALAVLASCGANGEPVRPSMNATVGPVAVSVGL
jgi:hypothetical protein